MNEHENDSVDAASLARIEGKLEVIGATLGGKIDTSMAGVNGELKAFGNRLTKVEQTQEDSRAAANRKVWTGPQITALILGCIAAASSLFAAAAWYIQAVVLKAA